MRKYRIVESFFWGSIVVTVLGLMLFWSEQIVSPWVAEPVTLVEMVDRDTFRGGRSLTAVVRFPDGEVGIYSVDATTFYGDVEPGDTVYLETQTGLFTGLQWNWRVTSTTPQLE